MRDPRLSREAIDAARRAPPRAAASARGWCARCESAAARANAAAASIPARARAATRLGRSRRCLKARSAQGAQSGPHERVDPARA